METRVVGVLATITPYSTAPLTAVYDRSYLVVIQSNVESVFYDLDQSRFEMPPNIYERLAIDLRHGYDEILRLRERNVAKVERLQVWEPIPGGGRALVIDMELLAEYCSAGFVDHEIARYLRCSKETVYRRRVRAGIKKRNRCVIMDITLLEVRCGSRLR
jgi:hypothetical protein